MSVFLSPSASPKTSLSKSFDVAESVPWRKLRYLSDKWRENGMPGKYLLFVWGTTESKFLQF
jgi:hypothetical protein